VYLPRNLGGIGFLSVLDVVECERRSLSSYLHNTMETLLLSAKSILRLSVMTTLLLRLAKGACSNGETKAYMENF